MEYEMNIHYIFITYEYVIWNEWQIAFHCKVQCHGGECDRAPFSVHELKVPGGAGPPCL